MTLRAQRIRTVLVRTGLVPSLLGLTVAGVLATGVATAATNSAGAARSIYGCARTSDGALRIVSATTRCKATEHRLHWNAAGKSSHTILHGTTPPADALGSVGDFYIDTKAHAIYGPKRSSGWPAAVSLIGPRGTSGGSGATGNTVLNGSGPPSASIGKNGDFYIDTLAQVIYGPKAGGAWPAGHPLTGPQGSAGATILNGSGAPANSLGSDGDFYIDTTAHSLYGPKAAGAWPGSGVDLVGPTDISIVRGSTTSVPASSNATGSASCPAGMTAVSGGILIDIAVSLGNLSLVTLDSVNGLWLSGGTVHDWHSEVHNLSTTTAQSFQEWAECVPDASATIAP